MTFLKIFKVLKKTLKYFLIIIIVLTLTLAIVFRNQIRTLTSLKKIPNTNLYVMHYYGSYNIDKIYEDGIDIYDTEGSVIRTYFPKFIADFLIKNFLPQRQIVQEERSTENNFACSVISYKTEKNVYFGCNYEGVHDPGLIMIRHSSKYNSSVSFVDLYYLMLDNESLKRIDFIERLSFLLAPYIVQEGFNDQGVAISEMSVENIKPPINPNKPSLTTSQALRLVLDYAKNVDDALKIIDRFNVYFPGCQCHIMIADAQGKSVVVEFIGDSTHVLPAKDNFQVATNHLLYGKSEIDNYQRCERYRIASDYLKQLKWEGNSYDLLELLVKISDKERTQWTGLYNLITGDFQAVYRNFYDDIYENRLKISNN